MSAVIKRETGGRVRTLPLSPRLDSAASARPDLRDARLAQLETELARIGKDLAQEREEHVSALETARAEGRRAGLTETVSTETDRLDALRDGISAAVDAFGYRLAAVDNLAAALAREALGKVFSDPATYADRLVSMISRRVRDVEADGVICVSVSPKDFSTRAAFQAVEAACARATEVVLDDRVDAGACVFRLTLGEADSSMAGQWSEIAALLDDMAAGR